MGVFLQDMQRPRCACGVLRKHTVRNRGVKRLCVCVSYLISPMLLQLLVELQGNAHHHFGLVPVGVGDVVQDTIEICSAEDDQVTNETQAKPFFVFVTPGTR